MARPLGNGEAQNTLLKVLESGECLTIDELAERMGVNNRQVGRAAAKLILRNFLDRMAQGCYQLSPEGVAAVKDGVVITSGPNGPIGPTSTIRDHKNGFRDRAWAAMRIRRVFTVRDIVMDAASGSELDPADNLHHYLRHLKAAGYVSEQPKRVQNSGRCGLKLWMLTRDTGPRAPAIVRARGAIHDFNIGETVPCFPR